MAKLVSAYTADRGSSLYRNKSAALHEDLRNMLDDVTVSLVGDINRTCDRFTNTRQVFTVLLDLGISPRSLQRKFRRLYKLSQIYNEQAALDKKGTEEDIPF